MNVLEQLTEFLKEKKNAGLTLPEIRYFDGINAFSTPTGQYKAKTLEESLALFLKNGNTNTRLLD